MGGSPFPRPAARPAATACPRCGSEDVRPLTSSAGYLLGDRSAPGSVQTDVDAAAGATGGQAWRAEAVWLVAVNVVLWGGALVLGLVVADTIPGWGFAPLALGFFLGLLCFGVLGAGRVAWPRPGRQSSPASAVAQLRRRAAYCPADDCIFLAGQARTYSREEWRQLLASAASGIPMTRTSNEPRSKNWEESF